MQKIGLKITRNGSVVYVDNADGVWNAPAIDYERALHVLGNVGNGDGIYMLSYGRHGTYVGLVMIIDANVTEVCLYIPATVDVAWPQLAQLMGTLKQAVNSGAIHGSRLGQLMAPEYPVREPAQSFDSSQGDRYACHYFGQADGDTLGDLLTGRVYEPYFSKYKLVLLIDNSLPVTVPDDCVDLSTVVPAAPASAASVDDDEPLPPPFDPNYDYYGDEPAPAAGAVEPATPAEEPAESEPRSWQQPPCEPEQPPAPQYQPYEPEAPDQVGKRDKLTKAVVLGVLGVAVLGGGLYAVGHHFGWFGGHEPVAMAEEQSIAPENSVVQPSADELLANALNAGTWSRDDFEAAGYGYLWDEINQFKFSTLLSENLPAQAASSRGWQRLVGAIGERAASDLQDFTPGQAFTRGMSIDVRAYLKYITTQPEVVEEEPEVEIPEQDEVSAAPTEPQSQPEPSHAAPASDNPANGAIEPGAE